MFGLENNGETLLFMLQHFNETMAILILHFHCFGALKIFTDCCIVIIINKITYSKQKMGCFVQIGIFYNIFPTACFPRSFLHGDIQMVYDMISACKWLMKR